MAGYELQIVPAAAKELEALPRKKDRQAIVARISSLAEEPRPPGCTKLSGVEDLYRIRHGGYRIVYSIEDDRLLVIVIRVADRKEVYRRLGEARSRHSARPFGKRR